MFKVENKDSWSRRNLTKKQLRIAKSIQDLKNGEFNYKLKLNTNDELEEIAELINSTADILKDHQKTLEQNLQKAIDEKTNLFEIYRVVIYSITQKKLNLLMRNEVSKILTEGETLEYLPLQYPEDVNKARELAELTLDKHRLEVGNIHHVKLCISEAATNVLKHAGTGNLEIRKTSNNLRIIVSDAGPGMDYNKLPYMLFLEGFSTKMSMGFGFSIIYKYASKIYLSTSRDGTVIIMDFMLFDCSVD